MWVGRPDARKTFTRQDLLVVPFTVAWCGFAVFWEVGVIVTHAPWFFPLWGSLFVAVGLYVVAGRFVVRRWVRRRTIYAVTDRRVLILQGDSEVRDMPLAGQPVSVQRSRNRRHVTVMIGTVAAGSARFGLVTEWPRGAGGRSPFGFFDVADAEPLLAAVDRARSDLAR